MHSLRYKILVTAAALVLLSQVGTVATVLVTARQDVATRAERSLETGAEVLTLAVTSQAEQFSSTVQALAADYGFKQAVGMNDLLTIESALANHAARAGADIAMLVDNNNRLLATVGGQDLPDEWLDLSAQQLSSNKNYSAFPGIGSAYIVVTVPVRAPVPIARLSMGYSLSDVQAEKLRDLTGLNVSIISRDRQRSDVVASSLPGNQSGSLLGALTTSDAAANHDSSTHLIRLDTQEVLSLQRPLLQKDGSLSVVLTKSVDDAMAPYLLLRTAAVALGTIPLIFALAGAVLLSRALTRPIQKLMEAAQRIQSGDYSEAVTINSGDEMNEFAAAFNAMQTEIAERENRIGYQSRHDSVTGLYSRDYMLTLLQSQLEAHPDDDRLAVLLITLSSLNDISGTLGHDIADAYLKQAASQLRELIDSRHPIGRVDGDCFLVLLGNTGATDARRIAEQLIAQLKPGIRLPNVNVSVNPTIGIAMYPEHGSNRDELLRRATLAINADPELRRPVRFYRAGDEEQRVKNLTLLRDLRQAIRTDQLQLHYQPKIRVADETVCGVEALVRWNHPSYGLLSPAQFIPVIEQAGNISLITRWALECAARQYQTWCAQGLDLHIAINFSSQDLLDQDLPWFVMDILRANGMPAQKLVVEITEEAMVREFGTAATVLKRMRDLGIRIAIDDFGTGYSSLSQLKQLPVDELKIDRSFVMRLPDDNADKAIISASVELAHKLQLNVVAEGVTTAAAFQWIQNAGIEHAQGYYWSTPLPPSALTDWVQTFSAKTLQQDKQLQRV
jgi:diguanylate cyclase (GGDEF)-like protein